MKLFRTDNTEDYTQAELDTFNAEWEQRVIELGLEEYTEEWDTEAQRFNDIIAKR